MKNSPISLLPAFLDFSVYPMQEDLSALDLQGENAKRTLIVVKQEAYPATSATFLSKVLGAVQYDLGRDTKLLRLSADQSAVSWAPLQAAHAFERVMLFGVAPSQLGLSLLLRPYVPTSWQNIRWLVAHDLSEVEQQPKLKSGLWSAMKVIFEDALPG